MLLRCDAMTRTVVQFIRIDARVPWSMIGVCAALTTMPLVMGWVMYQLLDHVLEVYEGKR